jgi:hypothetical protein
MPEDETLAIAEQLGLTLADPTTEGLVRAIRRELVTLQADDLTDEQQKRRHALTDALATTRRQVATTSAGNEVVTLSADSLAALVKAAAAQAVSGPSVDERMRTGVQVAISQARRDFRTARTLPLAGFAVVLAFVWSQRETFGVDLTEYGSYFGWGALAVVVLAGAFHWLVYLFQRADEKRLRLLYEPDTQGAALIVMVVAYEELPWRDEPDFSKLRISVKDFRESLVRVTSRRPEEEELRPGHLLSTVDMEAALSDAAELAVERFVKLGVLSPREDWTGQEYRLTDKWLTDLSGPR